MLKENEKDWLGPDNEEEALIYKGQSDVAQKKWFFSKDLIELDPNYSEFSVRIHDPRCRSLSFNYRTLAILPKTHLKTIHALIGKYLEAVDEKTV